jgi:DNA-binding FadR family transcriptional regulator
MSEPLNRIDDAAGLESRHADDQRPYQIAYDILRQHIVGKQLPPGLVLLESRIAELMDISRAPVRRALELLHRDGFVRRFEGRGYLVGADDPTQTPLRIDLREAGFTAPAGMSESIGLFTWERIYREVETAVGRTTLIGALHSSTTKC